MIVIVMGVSGAGKSTIGRRLASSIGWEFHDADDLHSPANIDKMRRGIPLTDADRAPWLDAVAALARRLDAQGRHAVVACSALREQYRRKLRAAAKDIRFVFLHASPEVITKRLTTREGHFMHPALLPSQLEALEPPENALWIDSSASPDDIVARVRRYLAC